MVEKKIEININKNLERYKRIRGFNEMRDKYFFKKIAYSKNGGEIDPKRLSLKLVQASDKREELERVDVKAPLARAVEIVRKGPGKQPSSSEQVNPEIDTSIQSDYRPVKEFPNFVRSWSNGRTEKVVSPHKQILVPFVGNIVVFDHIGGAT